MNGFTARIAVPNIHQYGSPKEEKKKKKKTPNWEKKRCGKNHKTWVPSGEMSRGAKKSPNWSALLGEMVCQGGGHKGKFKREGEGENDIRLLSVEKIF